MASFGACKLFSPSATEAASLKVSINQGFYLKMQSPHSPLYTLKASMLQTLTVPQPSVALHCSVSTWPSAPYTEITSIPNSSRWEDSSLMSTLEELQALGKQKLQDQQTFCQVMCCHHWSTPTFQLLQSGERHALSTSCCITAVKISAFPGILLGMKLNIFERALRVILWFWRQINYFKIFKERWRERKSSSLQSFGEIWGIWLNIWIPCIQVSPGLQYGVTGSFSCISQWLISLFTLCRR